MDLAAGEIKRRFDHNNVNTVKQIEMLLVNAGNGVLTDSFDPRLPSYLKDDYDLECLKTPTSCEELVANAGDFPVTGLLMLEQYPTL